MAERWKKLWDKRDPVQGGWKIMYYQGIRHLEITQYRKGSEWDVRTWLGNAHFPLIGERVENLGTFKTKLEALKFAHEYMEKGY